MSIRIRLAPDQEALYREMKNQKHTLDALLPGTDPDEVMRTFIELGISFCVCLAQPPDQRAKLEEKILANQQLSGLMKFAHWLWLKGETPGNARSLSKD